MFSAVDSLADLYKKAGDLMNNVSDAAELKSLSPDVDFAYEHLYSLRSSLSDTDLVLSSSNTKADFGNEHLSFKMLVQQWFDKVPSGNVEHSHSKEVDRSDHRL